MPVFRQLLRGGAPLRLDHLTVGFPAAGRTDGPSTAFLGVPIDVRGQAMGVLYFADPTPGGAFDDDDQRLAIVLAGAAAVALDGIAAQADAGRRQAWLAASARTTRELLGEGTADPLRLVAEVVRDLADAEFVAIMLRENGRNFRTEVTIGGDGRVYLDESVNPHAVPAGAAILAGRAARYPSFEETVSPGLPNPFGIGPVMLAPMSGADSVNGVLCVGRQIGRPEFSEPELTMATTFAGHVTLALELADAQAAAARARLLEERGRITHALQDTVIERLLAVGFGLEGLARSVKARADQDRLTTYVNDLDETISQLRAAILHVGGDENQ